MQNIEINEIIFFFNIENVTIQILIKGKNDMKYYQ